MNHGVARDPRARLVVDDGRNFLLTTGERYDVITSEPMPPHHAGVVNLYSKEYYQLARERLAAGGFVVQWLPMHQLTLDESLQIMRTVQDVFPETTLWLHTDTGIIVARRDAPIRIDLARVARALELGGLRAELDELGVKTPLDFAKMHALGPAEIRAVTSSARPVTDDRPSLEFHALDHVLAEFHGPYTLEQARTMAVIWRARADSAAPLADAASPLAADLAAWRKLSSQTSLANVQRYWKVDLTHLGPPAGRACASRLPRGALGRELTLPRVVDGLAEDPRQLLRGVEAHRVLRGHEVEPPLGLPVQRLRRLDIPAGAPALRAATIASMRSVVALAARCSSSWCRSWMSSTRLSSSFSGTAWQVWQARLMFSSGLRTQWSLTLRAPTRW